MQELTAPEVTDSPLAISEARLRQLCGTAQGILATQHVTAQNEMNLGEGAYSFIHIENAKADDGSGKQSAKDSAKAKNKSQLYMSAASTAEMSFRGRAVYGLGATALPRTACMPCTALRILQFGCTGFKESHGFSDLAD